MKLGSRPPRCGQDGFTLVLLLLVVAIVAAQLLAAAYGWSMAARRSKESELFFRGGQYRTALISYAAQPPHSLPHELSELLEDRRSGTVRRHLRELYGDPVADAPTLEPVRDAAGAIVGVHSISERWVLKGLDHPRRYSEIIFGIPTPASSAASGSARS